MILKLKDESIADVNATELWEEDVLFRKSVAELFIMYELLVGRECEYAELIDALYGSAVDRQLFKESSNAIRYISQWYVQNHRRDPSLDPIFNAFQSIVNADSMDGIKADVLPKLFQNAPFDLLKPCLKSAIEQRGWINADESLPIVAAALGCIRHS